MAKKQKKTAGDKAAEALLARMQSNGRNPEEGVKFRDLVELVRDGVIATPDAE